MLQFCRKVRIMTSQSTTSGIKSHILEGVYSELLQREVKVELFLPDTLDLKAGPYPLLLLNDGQDAAALQLESTLRALYGSGQIEPIVVAAVHAGNRLQEYGVAGRPDFKKRGAKAAAYDTFLTEHLLPWLEAHYPVSRNHKGNTMAGCSLGALSALDVVWKHSDIFHRVGCFSGAFWWRRRDLSEGYTDNDRIVHRLIRRSKKQEHLRFWFQAGTEDETADRNANGIIDAIDDTLDLIAELHRLGYKPYYDTVYYEMQGGKHHCDTWAEALPVFLKWAFPKA
jgi:enterochelin esterase-like enzyme